MRRSTNVPRHHILPDIPTGYPLNDEREWVSIVVPQATTNLFLNPSFETNTSNWTRTGDGSGSSLTRVSTQQCRGAYSGALTIGTSGTYVQIVGPTITNGVTYAMSFHVRAPNARPVTLADLRAVYNGSSSNVFGRLEFIGNGWWRASVVFKASATTAPGLRVLGSASQVWYVDACQLEASSVVTTYCDGDELGLLPVESPLPFRWNGTPHASTSTRSGTTRAGGVVRDLDAYGLTLVSIQGLGAGPVENIFTPLGNAPGAVYQTTQAPERTFTLGGRFAASDGARLSRYRGALRRDLSASLVGQPQPVRLLLQKYRGAEAIGAQVQIDASYAGGLEGDEAALYGEDVAIQFVAYQPDLVSVVSQGAALDMSETSSSGYAHFYDDTAGTFTAVSGLNGAIEPNACIWAPVLGRFVLGGQFTAPGTRVCTYDPATGSTGTLGSGLSATVRALVETPDGRIYAGGDQFTISAATGYLAYWDGSAWAFVGGAGSLPGPVYAIAFDPIGQDLYLGVRDSGGSNAELWRYDIALNSVANIADGTGGFVYDLAFDVQQRLLYIGGSFANLDGVADADAIAVLDIVNSPTIAAAVGGPANDTVWSLTLDAQRRLIAAGEFTTIGGISAEGFARWNGTRWEPIEGLTANTTTPVAPYVAYDADRETLWVLSAADPADDPGIGGINYILVEYQGSVATLPGANEASANIVAAAPAPSGMLFGRSNTATIRAGGVVSLTNDGTALTPPVILVHADTIGFSDTNRFWQARNLTTRQRLDFFALYGIPRNDQILVDLRIPRVLSRQRGDVTFGLSGATTYDFALVAGANRVQALTSNDNFTALAIFWHPRYGSLDDTVPGAL